MNIYFRGPDFGWRAFKRVIRGDSRIRVRFWLLLTLIVWVLFVFSVTIGFWGIRNKSIQHNQHQLTARAILQDSEHAGETATVIYNLISNGVVDEVHGVEDWQLLALADGELLTYEPERVFAESTYWKNWVPIFAASLYGLLSTLYLCLYASTCLNIRQNYLLCDLPWRKKWPIAFVAFTALPFGWICYSYSYAHKRLYLRELRKREDARVAEQAEFERYFALRQISRTAREALEDIAAETPVETPIANQTQSVEDVQKDQPEQLPEYPYEPITTRHFYRTLCSQNRAQITDKRTAKLQLEVDAKLIGVQHSAAELKRAQDCLNEARANLRTFTAAAASFLGTSIESADAEFERLRATPGVIGMIVEDDCLLIYVRVTYTYNGKTYDLGDWSLRFGAGTQIRTHIVRSSVKSNWRRTAHPSYQEKDGSFCMNSRKTEIDEHLAAGRYLEAVVLTIDTMRSVNEEDLDKLPRAFKEAA